MATRRAVGGQRHPRRWARAVVGDDVHAGRPARDRPPRGEWKLGQKGKDNGVLVVVAPKDRKMRIEVGYGLEGTLTDVTARRIIAENVAPAFRENRFAAGIDAVLAEIDEHVPRRDAVAAYLHEKNGDLELAARLYADAARNAPSLAERDHQMRQAARLNQRLRRDRARE